MNNPQNTVAYKQYVLDMIKEEALPMPTSASVDQFIMVSGVDENGKITSTETASVINLQVKNITPTENAQTILPDDGYIGLKAVIIDGVDILLDGVGVYF